MADLKFDENGNDRRGWIKSSQSSGYALCVEVLHRQEAVSIRDSKSLVYNNSQPFPIITVSTQGWNQITDEIKTGSPVGLNSELEIKVNNDKIDFRSATNNTVLNFTNDEFLAFVDGVKAGEFDRHFTVT